MNQYYSYFFISSVISKSSSILFLFLFYFYSSFLYKFSFLNGVLELDIFSSLFSIWNDDFLPLPSASEGGGASLYISASFSPSMSSMLHFAYLISFWLLASCTASSKIYCLCDKRAGYVGLWVYGLCGIILGSICSASLAWSPIIPSIISSISSKSAISFYLWT